MNLSVQEFIELAAKGTLLLVAAFSASRMLRPASAAVRHALWSLTFAALLLLPFLGRSVGALHLTLEWPGAHVSTVAPSPSASNLDAATRSTEMRRSAQGAAAPATTISASSPPGTRGPLRLELLLLAGYLGGVVVRMAGVLFAAGRLSWTLQRAHAVTTPPVRRALEQACRRLGLTELPRVVVSDAFASPCVWGIRRGVLILPPAVRCAGPAFDALLLHECAHLRRRDPLVRLFAECVCAIYWFHPLTWRAMRRLQAESECAADDLVLQSGMTPTAYAEHLISWTRVLRRDASTWALAPMATGLPLRERVQALLETRARTTTTWVQRVVGALVALVVVVPLSAMTFLPSVEERWSLEPVATLKASDGAGFTDVRSVLLDAKGEAWVIDGGGKTIEHYGPDGKHLGSLGRIGSGPKEFRDPYSLAWAGNDLLLYDPGNSRVVRWKRNGEWVTQWTVSRLTGGAWIQLHPAGGESVWLMQGGHLGAKYRPTFVRVSGKTAADTLWEPERKGGMSDGADCRMTNGGIAFFSTPFAMRYVILPTADGRFATLDAGGYALTYLSAKGDTLRRVEHSVPRAPISDAEWASGIESFQDFKKKNPTAECNNPITRPSAKAASRAMFLDDRGRAWVERVTVTGFAWDVWDGVTLVATAPSVPRDEDIPVTIHGDRIAMTVELPEGGHVVRVYRIRKEASR